jgi:hypothetical protein
MDKELQAIRDAWDKDVGSGRDADKARQLAKKYVDAHPDQFESLKGMTVPQLVNSVDVFRAAGMETEQWRVEAWLLDRVPPQNIGGEYQAEVRL